MHPFELSDSKPEFDAHFFLHYSWWILFDHRPHCIPRCSVVSVIGVEGGQFTSPALSLVNRLQSMPKLTAEAVVASQIGRTRSLEPPEFNVADCRNSKYKGDPIYIAVRYFVVDGN